MSTTCGSYKMYDRFDLAILRLKCFQVYITPILSAPHEIMNEAKGATFVSEVFWNLRKISDHHQRMLGSLLTRQRDQHPLVQSVADIILDCKPCSMAYPVSLIHQSQMRFGSHLNTSPISNTLLCHWIFIGKNLSGIPSTMGSSETVLKTPA